MEDQKRSHRRAIYVLLGILLSGLVVTAISIGLWDFFPSSNPALGEQMRGKGLLINFWFGNVLIMVGLLFLILSRRSKDGHS